jgi:GntR family transcriptional regulator
MQFQIQPDSEIPASKQLFDQIRFAIASRQYPPGHRLPSTRQLAMITGLHRNTISKIYQQLENDGLVESIAGSGIYVKARGHENDNLLGSPLLEQNPEIGRLIRQSLASFLAQGLTLEQIRELLLAEIDWRSQSGSCHHSPSRFGCRGANVKRIRAIPQNSRPISGNGGFSPSFSQY